jgi:ArsR family transcriptional regulator
MNAARMRRIARALADETRLRIFEAISKRDDAMTCGEIVSMRGVGHATVSHHLKVLSDAELITCRRRGQFVYSEPVPGTLEDYTRALLALSPRGKKKSR